MKRRIWILAYFLLISVCGATEDSEEKVIAMLPEGISIELVGLRNYSIRDLEKFKDRNYPWWKPDGTTLAEPPDMFKGRTSSTESYWFVICIRGCEDYTLKAIGPRGSDPTVQSVSNKGKGFEKDDLRSFTLRFAPGQKQADIKLGLALDDWKVVDSWSFYQRSTPYNMSFGSSEPVILRCPEQKDSDVVAEITQTNRDDATRLVLFDKEGRLHKSVRSHGGSGKGLVRYIHRFKNLDKNNIEHIEFQARAYDYWITFSNVSLQMGQKTQVQAEIKKPGHLLPGEFLPNFDGIKVDFAPNQTKGTMILVCFFDMQQRPSRNCIMHLSKRAQELEAKDVVVIAVQASKVDENKLKEWVKKNKISFPVGMIQADEEKTRFTWGVKSLPWLILTDREHIVRAEDFALAELNAKIKEANEGK